MNTGIDLGDKTSHACLIDAFGAVLDEIYEAKRATHASVFWVSVHGANGSAQAPRRCSPSSRRACI